MRELHYQHSGCSGKHVSLDAESRGASRAALNRWILAVRERKVGRRLGDEFGALLVQRYGSRPEFEAFRSPASRATAPETLRV
jgi:hypothetical protein